MATMKDIEARTNDLEARVARLERLTGHGTPADAESSQEARDRKILGRHARSYADAVEQQAARDRQAARDKARSGADASEEGQASSSNPFRD